MLTFLFTLSYHPIIQANNAAALLARKITIVNIELSK